MNIHKDLEKEPLMTRVDEIVNKGALYNCDDICLANIRDICPANIYNCDDVCLANTI